MALNRKHAEPHVITTRRSRAGAAPALLATIFGLVLVGIGIWGLWISADVARLVDGASVGPANHNLHTAAFLLVWAVVFGPFLYFGTAVLWRTFVPESSAWLGPLRLFTFVVGLRAAAEERRQLSSNKPGERALPAPHPPEQAASPPSGMHDEEDQKPK